jgi:hypothetical protein
MATNLDALSLVQLTAHYSALPGVTPVKKFPATLDRVAAGFFDLAGVAFAIRSSATAERPVTVERAGGSLFATYTKVVQMSQGAVSRANDAIRNLG